MAEQIHTFKNVPQPRPLGGLVDVLPALGGLFGQHRAIAAQEAEQRAAAELFAKAIRGARGATGNANTFTFDENAFPGNLAPAPPIPEGFNANQPGNLDVAEAVRNLISTNGGAKAFLANPQAFSQAFELLGSSQPQLPSVLNQQDAESVGFVNPATGQAPGFSAPVAPTRTAPVSNTASPSAPKLDKETIELLSQITKKENKIAEKKKIVEKSFDGFRFDDEQKEKLLGEALQEDISSLDSLKAALGDSKTIDEDRQAGKVTLGIEQAVSRKQEKRKQPQLSRQDQERITLFDQKIEQGNNAARILSGPKGRNLAKNVVTALTARQKEGADAFTSKNKLLGEFSTPTTDVGKIMQEVRRGLLPESIAEKQVLDAINKDKALQMLPLPGEVDSNGNQMEGLFLVSDVPGPDGRPKTPQAVTGPNGMQIKGSKFKGKTTLNLPGLLTPSTVTALQKDIIDAEGNLTVFDAIEKSFKPEFLTTIGRAKGGIQKFINKTGVQNIPLLEKLFDKETFGFLDDQTVWFAQTEMAFYKWRKWVTGVAGGAVEMQSIRESYLDSKGDTPVTFQAKMRAVRGITDGIVRQKKKLLREGITDDSPELQRRMNPIVNDILKQSGLSKLLPAEDGSITLNNPRTAEDLIKQFEGQ